MSDQEGKISLLFKSIENEFSSFERIEDPRRAESKLSLITSMIRDCKGCVVLYLPWNVPLVQECRILCPCKCR